MTIEGKRIIVTGSASGMGEATLKAYVQAGASMLSAWTCLTIQEAQFVKMQTMRVLEGVPISPR